MEFTIIHSRAMTLSRSPQCRAFSRAVMNGKWFSSLPIFPVGWGVGAVVTNDWCIILCFLSCKQLQTILCEILEQVPGGARIPTAGAIS